MTNGAAALFMLTAYQQKTIYFGDTPLVPPEALSPERTPDLVPDHQCAEPRWGHAAPSLAGARGAAHRDVHVAVGLDDRQCCPADDPHEPQRLGVDPVLDHLWLRARVRSRTHPRGAAR